MQVARNKERIVVNVSVTVTTVLESLEATVIDLTEYGAQVTGAALPAGTQFMLDCDGHSTFATVRWTEIDRMGVRFRFPLRDGPLHEALEMALATRRMPPPRSIRPHMASAEAASMAGAGSSAAAMPRSGFGRRSF